MTTVVQDAKATNGLAQTFNIIYGGTPVEGNFLVAFLFHDETSTDIEDITSSGWRRLGTTLGTLSTVDYRISVWAKFAGSSEPTTVAVDLGEINRRTHGYVVEYSGVPLTVLPAADAAANETKTIDLAGTSNTLDNSIQIGGGQLGLAMVGLNGASPTTPSWTSEITENEDWSNNFRASAIGFVDPPATVQPEATWGTPRFSVHVVFVIGEAIVPVTVKAHSSFQLIQV